MSGLLPPPIPPVRPRSYVYCVVDVSTDPNEILEYKKTRKQCREFIEFSPDADNLRIRRGELKLFTS